MQGFSALTEKALYLQPCEHVLCLLVQHFLVASSRLLCINSLKEEKVLACEQENPLPLRLAQENQAQEQSFFTRKKNALTLCKQMPLLFWTRSGHFFPERSEAWFSSRGVDAKGMLGCSR